MRVVRIAILTAALTVMGVGFAAPAGACKPVNNGCSAGSCRLVVDEPNPEGFGAPYFECYY
ncbi:MAG: hypothetical protein ABR613_01225 [Actinomycetota bacterium]